MPACHGHNEACCNIPPVVASGYAAKGSYEELGGLKTCKSKKEWCSILFPSQLTTVADVTGPADATRGIISVYDIFGYFDQTIQGADILAFGDENHKYKVFMPDWFKGSPCPIEWSVPTF